MQKLLVVSNRVERLRANRAATGGLSAAIGEVLLERQGTWLGWNGEIVDNAPRKINIEHVGKLRYATMSLSPIDHDQYYSGFANRTLWPLFHHRVDGIHFSKDEYDGYLRVNDTFANAVKTNLSDDTIVWVHDYHLIPLARALRARGAQSPIGFFLHIPFPAADIFATLPRNEDLGRALFDYDLVGFQTKNDAIGFIDYAVRYLGAERPGAGSLRLGERTLRTGVFPVGLDVERFASLAGSTETLRARDGLKLSSGGSPIILGVDRLDYSKGIPERCLAVGQLLARHNNLIGRVKFVQIAVPSRENLTDYRELRRRVARIISETNGKYSSPEWSAIRFVLRSFSRTTLAGYYRASQVGLVTPLRDGLNLVAKEYVAAQDPENPGVLVLSKFAGSAVELTDALIVNPNDLEEVADAMAQALAMPKSERISRWQKQMASLRANTASDWSRLFLAALERTKHSQ